MSGSILFALCVAFAITLTPFEHSAAGLDLADDFFVADESNASRQLHHPCDDDFTLDDILASVDQLVHLFLVAVDDRRPSIERAERSSVLVDPRLAPVDQVA